MKSKVWDTENLPFCPFGVPLYLRDYLFFPSPHPTSLTLIHQKESTGNVRTTSELKG